MFIDLPESILQYWPTSLFATEKFESYNGILRKASIHSNRQSPGQDIAITFSNYHSFRQIFSGGFFFDKKKLVQASNPVKNTFSHNPLIQKIFGYNISSSLQNLHYPSVKKSPVAAIDKLEVPEHLKTSFSNFSIQQISELNLNEKQVLKKNYFILVLIFHVFILINFFFSQC